MLAAVRRVPRSGYNGLECAGVSVSPCC
jgi:hypothetical protein